MAVSIGILFAPVQLGSSVATIYTNPASPASITLINGRVRFTNTSNATQAYTWYAVPSGGTASAANCQGNAETLSANTHIDLDVPLLGPGGSIQAFAGNASDVTISALAGTITS